MALEIERKFTVHAGLLPPLGKGQEILQGYLSRAPEIRIRICNDYATYAIKIGAGLIRLEFEYPIPRCDADSLLAFAISSPIDKKRYRIRCNDSTWIVDEFFGRNKGLWLAEIELKCTDEIIEIPSWVDQEVTEDPLFTNQSLSAFPLTERPTFRVS